MTDKIEDLAEKIKKLPSAGIILAKIAAADTPEQKEKAYAEAKQFLIQEGKMKTSDTKSMVDTIRTYDRDIEITKNQIATLREIIQDKVKEKQEWIDLEEAREALQRARSALSTALLSDGEYNNRLEELAELRDKFKDQKQIQSDFIVAYYAETKEAQIELGANGDARSLVLSGKLGKKQKYQISLGLGQLEDKYNVKVETSISKPIEPAPLPYKD